MGLDDYLPELQRLAHLPQPETQDLVKAWRGLRSLLDTHAALRTRVEVAENDYALAMSQWESSHRADMRLVESLRARVAELEADLSEARTETERLRALYVHECGDCGKLQSRVAALEAAIDQHRRDVWGDGEEVGHDADRVLYGVRDG